MVMPMRSAGMVREDVIDATSTKAEDFMRWPAKRNEKLGRKQNALSCLSFRLLPVYEWQTRAWLAS